MITNRYKLEDYIITEYNDFFCTWEMNIVLGEHRTGDCFIIGDILIIHSSSCKKNGCLKLEYDKKLSKLPVWTKTFYYCFSDSLRDVNTGKKLSNYLGQARIEKEKYGIDNKTLNKKNEYQLNQHKLIVQSDERILWEKYNGLNKISGSCIIKSGILFIGQKTKEIDVTQGKKEWLHELKLLPKWDRTFTWGYQRVLHDCRSGQAMKKSESVAIKLKRMKSYIAGSGTDSSSYKNKKRKKATKLTSHFQELNFPLIFFDWVKSCWIIIKPTLISNFKFGSSLFLAGIKKIIIRIQVMIQYFRSR